ncbi:MAG: hypothetical protein AAGL49_11955, partial [Pseudomonadota bacterium]
MTRTLIWALMAVWAGLYAWSFIAFQITAPTDFGFTKGLNRVTTFLGWQAAAGAVGVVVWMMGGAFERGSVGRWLARGPVALAALLVLAIIGLIAYARISDPSTPGQVPADMHSGYYRYGFEQSDFYPLY